MDPNMSETRTCLIETLSNTRVYLSGPACSNMANIFASGLQGFSMPSGIFILSIPSNPIACSKAKAVHKSQELIFPLHAVLMSILKIYFHLKHHVWATSRAGSGM